jgi:ABC-type branched-subunit amino acid transport system ATPase component
MLLSVEKIDVYYGSAQVISNVSLGVAQGEMVFIVGRNGAGKTTLLKTISGFIHPRKGTILFDSKKVNGLRLDQLSLMGVRYVFQDKRVFTQLTVRENIELAAYPTREKPEKSLEKVVGIYPGLTRFLDKKAGGLSGGQRQLLLLGRALIGEPKLLLIDEPTEGLAAGTIEEVFKVLKMMKGCLSLVIVEQNLAVVSQLADRVYIMQEGRISMELATQADIQDQQRLEKYL